MKFFADENLARNIVTWLRAQGHEVLYAAEAGPGTVDAVWLARAEKEERVVLTADKDFGELIFRDGLNSHGVLLLRLTDLTVTEALECLERAWSIVEANPAGRFIVVTPRRVRVRMLPPRE